MGPGGILVHLVVDVLVFPGAFPGQHIGHPLQLQAPALQKPPDRGGAAARPHGGAQDHQPVIGQRTLRFIGVICMPFVRRRIQDNMNSNYTEELDIPNVINENFRTGENIIYDSEVENDLRDVLGSGVVDIKATLGEETDEMYRENGMDIYTFGMITVAVNQEEVIQDILIDYTVGENKKEYGIYGIAGISDADAVKTILGTPDQEYEKELCYRFDREFGLGLNINFSDDGMVEQLEYYYVQ